MTQPSLFAAASSGAAAPRAALHAGQAPPSGPAWSVERAERCGWSYVVTGLLPRGADTDGGTEEAWWRLVFPCIRRERTLRLVA